MPEIEYARPLLSMSIVPLALPLVLAVSAPPGHHGRQETKLGSSHACPAGVTPLPRPADLVNRRWQRREDQIARTQNNVVRMYRDSATAAFTHPVVYIEYGSHEFFPTDAWSYHASPRHDGRSRYRYLSAPPPNLGEVEHPMAEVPEAVFILQFNGVWGAFARRNPPPQGPPLHDNWTWPASSSVRGRLVDPLGF